MSTSRRDNGTAHGTNGTCNDATDVTVDDALQPEPQSTSSQASQNTLLDTDAAEESDSATPESGSRSESAKSSKSSRSRGLWNRAAKSATAAKIELAPAGAGSSAGAREDPDQRDELDRDTSHLDELGRVMEREDQEDVARAKRDPELVSVCAGERLGERWRRHVYFLLHRAFLRYWVMYTMLLFNVLVVMMLVSFLATSVFLLADRELRAEDHFIPLAAAAIGFALLTVLYAPSLMEAVNKIRADCFDDKPHWFSKFRRHLLVGVGSFACSFLIRVARKCHLNCIKRTLKYIRNWIRSPFAMDDLIVVFMFWVPLVAGVLAGLARQSLVHGGVILIQTSLGGSLAIVLFYCAYRYYRKLTQNDFEWFLMFARFLTGQRKSKASGELRGRLVVASCVWVFVLMIGAYGVATMVIVQGLGRGLIFLGYFLFLWPSISYNLVIYVKDIEVDLALDDEPRTYNRSLRESMERASSRSQSSAQRPSRSKSVGVDPERAQSVEPLTDDPREMYMSVEVEISETLVSDEEEHHEEEEHREEAEEPQEAAPAKHTMSFSQVVSVVSVAHRRATVTKEERTVSKPFMCMDYLQFRNAKIFIIFAVLFLIFGVLVYPSDDETRDGRGPVVANAANFSVIVPGAPEHYQYGVCGSTWRELNILDYALLSQLSYSAKEFFADHFAEWFPIASNSTDGWRVVGQNDEDDAVTFLEFFHTGRNVSVIAVRGTATGADAAADAVMLIDAALVQLCPLIYVLPDIVIRKIVTALNLPGWLLFPDTDSLYFSPLLEYTERVQAQREVVLTGHSLGGFLAKFIGVKLNLTAVTFAAPGLLWSLDRFDLSAKNLERVATTVAAQRDIVPAIGKLGGNVQNIECLHSSPTCHLLSHYICELHSNCGDKRGRPALVEQCNLWHKDHTKIS